jgi:hypothetical protein
VFPPADDDGLWRVLSRYFVPAENLRKRAERDRVPYDLWAAQGFIEATPGNVVDYTAIEQRIRHPEARQQRRPGSPDCGTLQLNAGSAHGPCLTARSASRRRASSRACSGSDAPSPG